MRYRLNAQRLYLPLLTIAFVRSFRAEKYQSTQNTNFAVILSSDKSSKGTSFKTKRSENIMRKESNFTNKEAKHQIRDLMF